MNRAGPLHSHHPSADALWGVQFTGVAFETVVHTTDVHGVPFCDDIHAKHHAAHLQTMGREDAHVVYLASGTTGWIVPGATGAVDSPRPDSAQIAAALIRHTQGQLSALDAQHIAAVALRMAGAVTDTRHCA